MRELKIGLVGAGWMGKAHAMCYRTQRLAFGGQPATPVLEILADVNDEIASRAARELGFRRHTADWREVIDDPSVDIVDINTPNDLHPDIALAAVAAGKHVYCEKPLANDAKTAFTMAEAAEKAGVITMVGFNYIKNPVQTLARRLVADGEIGEPSYYRGSFSADFLGRPEIPFSWRNDKAKAGSGVVSDIGAHCFAYLRHLVDQPVEEVVCDLKIVIPERPAPAEHGGFSQDAGATGQMVQVDTDDVATVMFRTSGGLTGHMEMSRVSLGKRMDVGYELTGTRGAVRYFYDHINDLQLYKEDGAQDTTGFKHISIGASDPRYAAFFPVTGIGAGYNDYKVMEVQDLIEAVAAGKPAYPDFRFAAEGQRVIDACILSNAERRWVRVDEIAV